MRTLAKWITSILAVALMAVLSLVAVNYWNDHFVTQTPRVIAVQREAPRPIPRPEPVILPEELHELTNTKRTENGVPPLTLNAKLNASALAKCNDMVVKDYWAHDSPDGQQPWHFITEAGYKYQKAAENLGKDYATSNGLIDGWMNSEGHRANLLNSEYNEVGYAVCKDTNKYSHRSFTLVVQHFATK